MLDSHNPAYARQSSISERRQTQQDKLQLPLPPTSTTTTIGSFPKTAEIRRARAAFKQKKLSEPDYQRFIEQQIRYCIETQEQLGRDVLVHGEAECNNMVEYFGGLLEGIKVTRLAGCNVMARAVLRPH